MFPFRRGDIIMKLLIVDDEDFTRECIAYQIDWANYDVEMAGTAVNGEDALEKIHTLHPDIVITDIKMPVMNGIELLEAIVREQLHVDVIMLSGFEEFEFAQKALNLGAKNFFLKPIDPAELLNAVIVLQEKKLALEKKDSRVDDLESFIRNVVYMVYTPEEMDTAIEKFAYLKDYWQAMIILQMDNISEALYIGEGHSVYKLLLQEIQSYCNSCEGCYLLEKSPHNMVLFIAGQGKEETEQTLSHMIVLLQKILQRIGYSNYVVGVSELNHTVEEVGKSYLEASRAVNTKYIYGNSKIYYADEGYPAYLAGLSDTGDVAKEIIDHTVYYNEDKIDELIERLFTIAEKHDICLNGLQQTMYMIAKGIIKHEALVNIDINSLYSNPGSIIMSLCTSDENREMKRKLKAFLHTIGRQLNKVKIKKPNQIVTKIKQYIQDCYQKQDLSLAKIAEEFNFSAAYLSTLFRIHCGQNITDYINAIRIEEACRLLAQESYKISYIAEAVGYSNATYFCKVFKKLKDVSPTDFRENLGKGQV